MENLLDHIDGFRIGDWITATFGRDSEGFKADKLVRIERLNSESWKFWVQTGGYLCHPVHKIRHATQKEIEAGSPRHIADLERQRDESDKERAEASKIALLLRDMQASAHAEASRLRKALKKYGIHLGSCQMYYAQQRCSCGLTSILASLDGEEGK